MIKISEEIESLFKYISLNNTSDLKTQKSIEDKILKIIAHYQGIIKNFRNKYKTDFETFKNNYFNDPENDSFEIENDYFEWEMAIEGIKIIKSKLNEIEYLDQNKFQTVAEEY